MKPDLFWIPGQWPGNLALITRPRGGDWLDDEAAGWREAGLDCIVSLLETDEQVQFDLAREAEAAENNGIQFISFPIQDLGVPADRTAAMSVLTVLVSALEAGKNVAVHCRQGIGRSGLLAAGLLIFAGIPPKAAIRTVSLARGRGVPETQEQRLWLERLPSALVVPLHG